MPDPGAQEPGKLREGGLKGETRHKRLHLMINTH